MTNEEKLRIMNRLRDCEGDPVKLERFFALELAELVEDCYGDYLITDMKNQSADLAATFATAIGDWVPRSTQMDEQEEGWVTIPGLEDEPTDE